MCGLGLWERPLVNVIISTVLCYFWLKVVNFWVSVSEGALENKIVHLKGFILNKKFEINVLDNSTIKRQALTSPVPKHYLESLDYSLMALRK